MQWGLKAASAGPCPPGPQHPRPPAGKGAGLCPGHHQAETRSEGGGHEGAAETRAHGRSAGLRGPFPGLSGHCLPGDLVRSYAAPPEPEDTPRLEPLSPQGKAGAGLGCGSPSPSLRLEVLRRTLRGGRPRPRVQPAARSPGPHFLPRPREASCRLVYF